MPVRDDECAIVMSGRVSASPGRIDVSYDTMSRPAGSRMNAARALSTEVGMACLVNLTTRRLGRSFFGVKILFDASQLLQGGTVNRLSLSALAGAAAHSPYMPTIVHYARKGGGRYTQRVLSEHLLYAGYTSGSPTESIAANEAYR